MKSTQLLAALTGVFVLCSVYTFYKAWKFSSSMQNLGEVQNHAAYVKNVQGPTMQALLGDTAEYSKKNPAVVPILQSLTNAMSKPMAVMPKPGAK